MAIDSACGFCKNTTGFRLEEHTPLGSDYKIYLVRCVQCGAAIGSLDFIPTAGLLQEIQRIKLALKIR
jgi:hypothetical protein